MKKVLRRVPTVLPVKANHIEAGNDHKNLKGYDQEADSSLPIAVGFSAAQQTSQL
jgi:hypothetical protein